MAQGGGGMRIKSVLLNLSAGETLKLVRIVTDGDRDEALCFLKECVKPQLDQATRDH